jgi:hypothetical protein
MARFCGTVKKNALEGGFWELHADDGKHYQLQGGDNSLRVEGQKVEIEGKIEKNAMGIGMTGPILSVVKWEKL